MSICFANERLYLVEQWRGNNNPQGNRVLVLTPQGETLQIFNDFPNARHG